ncbi:MAG: hypothetical protein ORN54_03250, partial [Cyclobacteriaceae bacterium]|nr:hypothetical protein [Cyclobacteriaceae bacterium]
MSTAFLCFYSFGDDVQAQQFYVGGNWLTSFRYDYSYNNLPSIFDIRGSLSQITHNTLFGYQLGYQHNRKHFFEINLDRSYYYSHKVVSIDPGLWSAVGDVYTDIGFTYKRNLVSLPISIYPLRIMAVGALVYRVNTRSGPTNATTSYTVNGVAVLNYKETSTYIDGLQVLPQVGLEAELPIYRRFMLSLKYTYLFPIGSPMITSQFTDLLASTDGYRYTRGGGTRLNVAFRWYLPGGTDILSRALSEKGKGKNWYIALGEYAFGDDQPVDRIALLVGHKKGRHVFESGIIDLATEFNYKLGQYDASALAYNLYVPLRYKYSIPLFKKGRYQNLEFLPSTGLALNLLPTNYLTPAFQLQVKEEKHL